MADACSGPLSKTHLSELQEFNDKEIRALVMSEVIRTVMTSPYEIPVPLRHNLAMRELNWKLLRVSKAVHVEAHQVFHASNKFFLTHTGSVVEQKGLKGLTCSICRAQNDLKFETGLVYLGHNHRADVAHNIIDDAIKLFKTPSMPLTFKHLTIDIKCFFFRSAMQIQDFVDSLRNVKVTDRLTITGLDIHVQDWLRCATDALMLRCEPVDFEMDMRDPETCAVEPFRAEYVPAISEHEMTSGLVSTEDLVDPVMMLTQYMGVAMVLGDHRYGSSIPAVLRR